jgi:hypothetical protein
MIFLIKMLEFAWIIRIFAPCRSERTIPFYKKYVFFHKLIHITLAQIQIKARLTKFLKGKIKRGTAISHPPSDIWV